MKGWMDYTKIQELKRDLLNKSQVSRKLGLDYGTVTKYWDMTPDEYAATSKAASIRKKKADEYKECVLDRLRQYPDYSASQLYDWLKEHKTKKPPFSKRALRDYVRRLRAEYNIPKPRSERQYEAVADPPMGHQAQVDMGETKVETPNGRRKKVYAFGMVLANSRHKFGVWQTHPWTTADFVIAHIMAFRFFGGRPEEIVYDQDTVLSVSENHGDIILTEGFQNFVNAMGFRVVLCRGADPESKGRVESIIKYFKHGFAAHRVLTTIDAFNEAFLAWLERTGNAEEHGTTKKIPAEVFAVEREHLIPVSEYSYAKPSDDSITYLVRKENTVLYKGNRYRVPVGTYKSDKKVYVHVIVEDGTVSLVDVETGVLYAKHPLSEGKGELIGDSSRKYRDKSKTILELESVVIEQIGGGEGIRLFLEKIHVEKRRYYRDQLGVIRNLFTEWSADLIRSGLSYCLENELYSAGELSSAVTYIAALQAEEAKKGKEEAQKLPAKYRGNGPQVRDLSEYANAMRRPQI